MGLSRTSPLSHVMQACLTNLCALKLELGITQHRLQVTLVHLYQAGMFADLDQISAASHLAPPASSERGRGRASMPMRGAKVSAAEAPLREEVQHKLQHLPPALLSTCQQVCLSVCLPVLLCHSVSASLVAYTEAAMQVARHAVAR